MENIKTLNKVDVASIIIARDLLSLDIGERVKSVKEYSDDLLISVGSVQKAFDNLEKEKAMELAKKGVNGKILEYKNKEKLIEKAALKSVVGVMPLPYSKRYEGLAMAIKSSFEQYGINFYFAYMQGSRIRLKMLENGIYDFAIMSNLAYINSKNENMKKVFSLGYGSYVSKHVLLVKNENGKNRIGIDKNSEDQYFLSKKYFKDKDCQFIDLSSDNIVKQMKNSFIDQAIISLDEIEENEINDIQILDIFDEEDIKLANEAVIVINKKDKLIETLINQVLDVKNIKKIQEMVVKKIIVPRY